MRTSIFAAAGVPTGVLIAPLMPGINDSPEQVEEILELCAEAGAVSIGGICLHLRGEVRDVFMDWLRSYRPDVVVSSGAGVAFPFFLLAKLFGKRTVYVEVYDRIDSPTMTGRLCYPFSDLFLLQWEEQRRNYPKGRVIGSLL